MSKCYHENINRKFSYSKKHGEEIYIRYSYCEECHSILQGGVSFVNDKVYPKKSKVKKVKPKKKKKPKKRKKKVKNKYTKAVKKSRKVKSPKKSKSISKKRVRKAVKKVKSKKKPKTKLDKTVKKDTNKEPSKDLPEAPNIASYARAFFNLKPSKNKGKKKKTKYKMVDADSLDHKEDDIDLFRK